MIQLAFKIAAKTGSAWSELIARESGSIYSHVEMWIGGPQSNATCFSSREPHGAGFEQIDLTTDLWHLVPVVCTPDQELKIEGFCLGTDGKIYDGVGLLGYQFKQPALHDYHAVFCSEVCAAALQKCAAKTLPGVPWLISPGELCKLAEAGFPVEQAPATLGAS